MNFINDLKIIISSTWSENHKGLLDDLDQYKNKYIHFTKGVKDSRGDIFPQFTINPQKSHGDPFGFYFYKCSWLKRHIEESSFQYGTSFPYYYICDIDTKNSKSGINFKTTTDSKFRDICDDIGISNEYSEMRDAQQKIFTIKKLSDNLKKFMNGKIYRVGEHGQHISLIKDDEKKEWTIELIKTKDGSVDIYIAEFIYYCISRNLNIKSIEKPAFVFYMICDLMDNGATFITDFPKKSYAQLLKNIDYIYDPYGIINNNEPDQIVAINKSIVKVIKQSDNIDLANKNNEIIFKELIEDIYKGTVSYKNKDFYAEFMMDNESCKLEVTRDLYKWKLKKGNSIYTTSVPFYELEYPMKELVKTLNYNIKHLERWKKSEGEQLPLDANEKFYIVSFIKNIFNIEDDIASIEAKYIKYPKNNILEYRNDMVNISIEKTTEYRIEYNTYKIKVNKLKEIKGALEKLKNEISTY